MIGQCNSFTIRATCTESLLYLSNHVNAQSIRVENGHVQYDSDNKTMSTYIV
jgi:hypothetical protein